MQPQQGFGRTSFWSSTGHFAYSSAAAAASLGPAAAAGVSPPLLQQLTNPDQAASTGAECEGLRASLTTASTTGLNNIQFSDAGVAAAAAVGVDIAPSWLAMCEAQAQQAEAQQTEAHQQQQKQKQQQANRVTISPPEQSDTGDRVWDEMLQAVCDSSPATDDVIIDLLASQLTTAAPEDRASKQQQQAAAAALAQGGGYPATHDQNLASPDPASVGSRAGAADVDHADPDPQHLLHIIHQQQYQLHQQQQQQYQLQQQLQQLFPTQMDLRQSTPPVDALLASTAAAAQLAATCGLATPQGPATTCGSSPAGAAGSTAICQQQWIAPTSNSTIPHTAAHSSTYPAAVPSQQTLLTPVPTSAPVEFNAIHNLVQLESTLGILSQQLAHFQSGVHQSVVQLLGANVQGQQQMLVPVGPATATPQYTATALPAQARGSEHGEVQTLLLQATSLQSPLQSPIMLG